MADYQAMPKSLFNINDMLSEVRTRGMAKPNRFEVIITPPKCVLNIKTDQNLVATESGYQTQQSLGSRVPARVSVFCEAASLPPTRINTSQQRIFGPASYHPQSADYGGDNITLTFMLDKWYTVKEFFDVWVDGVVNRETGLVYYQDNYLSQGMTITQLDEEDNAHYTAVFEDVFPIAISPIQLDANSNNQVAKMSVTFCYRRWRSLSMTTSGNLPPPRETPRNSIGTK